MTVYSQTLRHVHIGASAIGLLMALGTLWLWVQALVWWGDTMALASALMWTFLTVIMWAFVIVVEWLQNRGE